MIEPDEQCFTKSIMRWYSRGLIELAKNPRNKGWISNFHHEYIVQAAELNVFVLPW